MLVTDGGTGQGRSAVAAVRSLARAGYRPVVTVTGPGSLAAASRYCSATVQTPAADAPGYAACVREAAAEHGALTTLVASDAALLALGHPVAELVDKERLAAAAAAAGLTTPPSRTVHAAAAVAGMVRSGEVTLPAVVKPLVSRQPAASVRSPAEAERLALAGPVLVQPFLQGTMRAVGGVVDGGRILAVVQQRYIRTWPMECGTASAAVTEAVDEELLRRLALLLSDHRGIFQVQFIGDVLLDVNPRVYGSLSLATAAGANLPGIWCGVLAGRPPSERVTARPGVHYRWIEGDLRHLGAAVRQRKMRPLKAAAALLPRRGTAHSVESLADPKPMLVRLARATAVRR